MAQEPLMKLAQADLGDIARRVLFALLAKLDFENWVSLSHTELGQELKIKRPNISRAVARLVDEGVLLVGPRVGVRGTYRLNPQYGWKGSARGHQEALQARMAARGMSVVAGGAAEAPEAFDDRTGDLFEERV